MSKWETNVYLLECKEGVGGGRDNYNSHVVQARTSKKARELCPYADEGNIWIDSDKTNIKLIGISSAKREKIILSSYNAG